MDTDIFDGDSGSYDAHVIRREQNATTKSLETLEALLEEKVTKLAVFDHWGRYHWEENIDFNDPRVVRFKEWRADSKFRPQVNHEWLNHEWCERCEYDDTELKNYIINETKDYINEIKDAARKLMDLHEWRYMSSLRDDLTAEDPTKVVVKVACRDIVKILCAIDFIKKFDFDAETVKDEATLSLETRLQSDITRLAAFEENLRFKPADSAIWRHLNSCFQTNITRLAALHLYNTIYIQARRSSLSEYAWQLWNERDKSSRDAWEAYIQEVCCMFDDLDGWDGLGGLGGLAPRLEIPDEHKDHYKQLVALKWAIDSKEIMDAEDKAKAACKITTMAGKNPFKESFISLLKPDGGVFGKFYSLPSLNDPRIDKLPYSIRILLESAIRNCDNFHVTKEDVEKILDWENTSTKQVEIPFKPARVLFQDFTGVPAVVDLACMRDAMNKFGRDSNKINPLVPVDLVVEARSENAVQANMELEFQRNKERYAFLKWGSTAFRNMLVVPPVSGTDQVNLEYLGRVVFNNDGLLYPDSVFGTDSHTTMINGLGVAGWGVGGIEAEAAMLGQPMSMVLPGVVGFKLSGNLRIGVTTTDLVLAVTQILRENDVVGKFVEFYGDGVSKLSLADRATIANMCPEYGATMGFFPVDDITLLYLSINLKSDETVAMIESYLRANRLFVDHNEPQQDRIYSLYVELNLSNVEACISGPKSPHDHVSLTEMKADWHACLDNKVVGFKGFNIPKEAQRKVAKFDFHGQPAELKHGSVVIAKITSSMNTSNPIAMLEAGMVARKAHYYNLKVKPWVKAFLAPGSEFVTKCLRQSGLDVYLERLGFHIEEFGCTTCIGNSGDLHESVASAISDNDIVAAAVLSGNRNFEGQVHPSIRANYLVSPALVVAYALAGTVDFDFEKEPILTRKYGRNVYLSDIWPTTLETKCVIGLLPNMFGSTCKSITLGTPMWNQLEIPADTLYSWNPKSTYIHEPPYFKNMTMDPPGSHSVKDAYCLLNFGDSITIDHISPDGSINMDSPAAKYLLERGVDYKDFNSYQSRCGNDEMMARGTFANIFLVNKLLNGEVGPRTIHIPTGEKLFVFDAAMRYKASGQDTIVLAGAEYGSGSSRDWAAKGPMLLGVKAVIAKSFVRNHRSNLVRMGIMPLCYKPEEDADSLGLTGRERYTIDLPSKISEIKPGQDVTVTTDSRKSFTCVVRFDTEVELAYFNHGGILPYVIRNFINQ